MGLPTGSVSGLATGIDWREIVSQIIQIERRRVDLVVNRKTEYEDKLEAFKSLSDLLSSLESATDSLRSTSTYDLFKSTLSSSSSSVDAEDILGVSAGSTAAKGTYDVVVSQVATARKLSSTSFSDTTTALNLSGEIVINGKALSINSTDDLLDIRDAINDLNAGVTASILSVTSTDNRLILTSNDTGEGKLSVLDASTSDLLQSLGFTDTTTSVKNALGNGAATDKYTSRTTPIGSLLGLSSSPSGTVQINGTNVSINLGTDSLEDIQSAIDAAGITGVSTSITSSTVDGVTKYRLEISGATSFSDSNNVLETLGVLEGGTSDVAAVLTGSTANTSSGSAITASTTFANIDGASVTNGDTITISGKDHNGNSVSATYTVTNVNTDTIQDLLTAIENAFSGTVSASVTADGEIEITDGTAGDSQLELTLTENNEGGGSLDFGTFSATTVGRKREVQSGQDASLTIDGVTISRSSNQITDVLTGVTLNLKSADSNTTVTVNIDRDVDSIKAKIEEFVDAYNAVVEFIGEQFAYDEEKGGAQGVLFGDATLRSVQGDLTTLVVKQVTGVTSTYSTLAMIGITLDDDGKLSIDQSELSSLLTTNFSDVRAVLAAVGTTSTGSLKYVSSTRDTEPGTYTVTINQVATQAWVKGTTDLSSTGLASDETLTITDTNTGRVATISLTSGSLIDAVVAAINEELQTEYAQVYTGSTANTKTTAAGGGAITSSTVWQDIDTGGDSNNITNGDTISFTGTRRYGQSVSGSYTISDKSTDTVQGLLSAIEVAFNNEVTATIDSNGKIVVTDKTVGDSKMSISITANNEGGGTLDFGTMSKTTTGRYAIEITASNVSGTVKLTHDSYGSAFGFSVSQTVDNLGMADVTKAGTDVDGTINGESATGSGQVLTGDSGTANVDGLKVRYTGTTTGDVGTVTFTEGLMESFYRKLYEILDQFDGYVSFKQTSLSDSIKRFERQIEDMEARIDRKAKTLIAQFVALENTVSRLQAVGNWLGSQLTKLG
jgi:flagellar hook-associated protein 2